MTSAQGRMRMSGEFLIEQEDEPHRQLPDGRQRVDGLRPDLPFASLPLARSDASDGGSTTRLTSESLTTLDLLRNCAETTPGGREDSTSPDRGRQAQLPQA
jgi:hypothetical protein